MRSTAAAAPDTADYTHALDGQPEGTDGIEVFLDGRASRGGEAEGDTLTSIEHVVTTARNDTVHGGDAAEWVEAGAGDDLLLGRRRRGQAGRRRGHGHTGLQRLGQRRSKPGSTGVAGKGGDAAGDTATGIENLTGSAHDDSLTGDAGANRLTGGAGADRIDGAGGIDTVDFSASETAVEVYLDGRASRGERC